MSPVQRQELGLQQGLGHTVVSIVPAALADVLHIAPLKDALYRKSPLGIIVQPVEVHIPEDASVKYGPWLRGLHDAKVGRPNG